MSWAKPNWRTVPLAGASVVVPTTNVNVLWDIVLKQGANTTNATWTATFSPNANGSSPDAAGYRYAFTALADSGSPVNGQSTSASAIQIFTTSVLQLNAMLMELVFDPGNCTLRWQGGTIATTGVNQEVRGFGSVPQTNRLSLILGVSAGVATGTVYYRPRI